MDIPHRHKNQSETGDQADDRGDIHGLPTSFYGEWPHYGSQYRLYVVFYKYICSLTAIDEDFMESQEIEDKSRQ